MSKVLNDGTWAGRPTSGAEAFDITKVPHTPIIQRDIAAEAEAFRQKVAAARAQSDQEAPKDAEGASQPEAPNDGEATSSPASEASSTATPTGGGWYALDPALPDGTDRVQGKANVPDGYTITEG